MALSIPVNLLFESIYDTLTGYSDLTDLVPAARILDYVPANASYPLVVIGPYETGGRESKSSSVQPIVTITAYSITRGFSQVNDILDQIVIALTVGGMALSGGGFNITEPIVEEVGADAIQRADKQIVREGSVKLRWMVFPTS